MRPFSVVQCLLATCVVATLADDPFLKDRDNVATTTTVTATASSATSTSGSTTTSSASATPTTSAANKAFHWNASEIAALVVLLGFIIFGIVFIATLHVRRVLAQRQDNAGIGAYFKYKRDSSVDMDVTDTEAMLSVNQREQAPHSHQLYSNRNTNNDFEG
jgi:beta-lactamase regulating signal transducer with metallopeptidase domain